MRPKPVQTPYLRILLPLMTAWTLGCRGAQGPSLLELLPEIENARLAALHDDPGPSRRPRQAANNFRLSAVHTTACGSPSAGDAILVGYAARDEQGDSSETATPRRRSMREPLPGFWDTVKRDLHDWPEVFWEDTKKVYGNKSNLLILGLAYGGSLALQEAGPDDAVEDYFDNHSTFSTGWRDAFAALGNPGTHFGIAGLWYLAGQQRQDAKTYDVGTKLFRALALNGVSTMLGQLASWDDAPNGEWGSFPSGHTSSTFTLASVLHREYGWWVGAPLYSLGALVAYSRLEDEEHYFSDVIMGAVMGLVIGHSVAADEPMEIFGGQIVPYVDPANHVSGLAWVKTTR